MNATIPIVLFVLGLIVGAVLIALARASEARSLRETVANRDARLERLQEDLGEIKAQRATLESRVDAEKRAAADKLALLEEARQKLADSFKALSADALQRNNQSFLDLAKSQLEQYQQRAKGDLEQRQQAIAQSLQPVRESLDKIDVTIHDLEKSRVGAYAALNEQVKALAEGHAALRTETGNLVRALRQPAVRGRWGEIQLRRVVEMAGMLKHCDFVEQRTVATEESRIRPDMIVHLPGDKFIVVDSKAPLGAYLDAVEAADEATRRDLMRVHAQNIRAHITALGKKSYWEAVDGTPEFVVLFIPGDSFFGAALDSDPELIEFGMEHHVITATPTTLIGLLRAIHYGWQQEHVALEARQISELGKELYNRVALMSKHLFQLQRGLTVAVESYNRAVGSMEGRVLVTARKFKDLKALGITEEIESLPQVESAARALQAPELTTVPDGLFPVPEPPEAPAQADDDSEAAADGASAEPIADFKAAMPTPLFADTAMPSVRESSARKS